MKKIQNFSKLLLTISIIFLSGYCYSQVPINLNDTNVVYKDIDGKVMIKDSIKSFMSKGRFSMKSKAIEGGKTEIILYRIAQDVIEKESKQIIEKSNKLLGTTFPAFKLKDITGKLMTQNDLKGQVTVVNFWFTGCKPCISEMPDLNKLTEKYKSVNFVAFTFEEMDVVKKFLLKHDFKYTQLPNAKDLISALGINIFPTHMILDRDGVVISVETGAGNDIYVKLESLIDRALQKR